MSVINKEKLNKVLNDRLDYNVKEHRTAGSEILVMQYGEPLCHITKGYKNAVAKIPLKPNMLYRLCSMTKPITGLAALIAVERGWFNLEDKVKDYLPEWADMDVAVLRDGKPIIDHKAASDLLIYQMLSHCNGILAETDLGHAIFDDAPRSAFESIEGMLKYACKKPLAFDPGTYTAYTGYTSFDVVAHIIEIKSGIKYSEFLDKNIFEPLGIRNITFHPTEDQWSNLVCLHDRTDAKTLVSVDMGKSTFEGFGSDYECAGASLIGNMEDYAKIAELLRCNGTYNGVTIVSPEMIAEMKKPRVPDGIPGREPNDSWGLGVRVKVHEDWLPEGIFGWSGAYGTHFWVDQKNGITAILLRNMYRFDTGGAGQMGIEFEKDVMSCLE